MAKNREIEMLKRERMSSGKSIPKYIPVYSTDEKHQRRRMYLLGYVRKQRKSITPYITYTQRRLKMTDIDNQEK